MADRAGAASPPQGVTRRSPRVPRTPKPWGQRALKPLAWILSLLPLAVLVWRAATDNLGAEPVEEVLHATGYWALVLLLATLAVSPLRKLSGWNPIIGVRRLLGLFAFLYATLHVAVYFGVEQFFDLYAIIEDIIKRPFITVGFLAWVLLIPLAATSTRGWIRRLGKRWQLLHRLVYLIAALGVVHFLWSTKVDEPEPVIFAVGLLVLLAFRAPLLRKRFSARE